MVGAIIVLGAEALVIVTGHGHHGRRRQRRPLTSGCVLSHLRVIEECRRTFTEQRGIHVWGAAGEHHRWRWWWRLEAHHHVVRRGGLCAELQSLQHLGLALQVQLREGSKVQFTGVILETTGCGQRRHFGIWKRYEI